MLNLVFYVWANHLNSRKSVCLYSTLDVGSHLLVKYCVSVRNTETWFLPNRCYSSCLKRCNATGTQTKTLLNVRPPNLTKYKIGVTAKVSLYFPFTFKVAFVKSLYILEPSNAMMHSHEKISCIRIISIKIYRQYWLEKYVYSLEKFLTWRIS